MVEGNYGRTESRSECIFGGVVNFPQLSAVLCNCDCFVFKPPLCVKIRYVLLFFGKLDRKLAIAKLIAAHMLLSVTTTLFSVQPQI